MPLFALFLAIAFAFAQTETPPAASSGWLERALEHDDLTRTYAVYAPETLLDPVPLVIALHPAGGSGRQMALITRFNELADASGALIAYPDGPGGYWDYGTGLPAWEGLEDARDDFGFIAAMIDEISAEWNVDSTRIYAVGYSNGARMAHRLACALPLAAAAMVAAPISDDITDGCAEGIVPVWMQHGTADRVVSFDGDAELTLGDRTIARALSVQETAQFYAARNGCDNPTVEMLYEPNARVQIRLGMISYQGCANGAAVDVMVAEGGGHGWHQVPEVDTSALIWTFFGQHTQIIRETNH